ncbi:hypothetical protein GCM10011506_39590 [Marivirga lumbricoides]|uniref:Uncharacterized protein n=1 Tax=Marivirga lumbricoides TaxID=1046115 RepID=A0A2T4DTK6_9BACT|nr:hypothetical protein C9994_04285 [Marivirga lumbricoides]GGC50051.1 hypothetical protein GCM10011506_39590 [Marivirga lumbricoides]
MLRIKSILILFFSVAIVSTGIAAVLVQQFQDPAFEEEINLPTEEVDPPSLQKKSTESKKPSQVRIQKEDAATEDDEQRVEKKNKSVLKSGSGFVTVFYVLVNYLFSVPFETQDYSSLQ